MNLYEVSQSITALIDAAYSYAEQHNGDIPEDLSMRIDALEMVREDKINNILKLYKNNEAMSEMIEFEVQSLRQRRIVHDHKCEWLKNWIRFSLKTDENFESAEGKISWGKSPPHVEIIDETLVPNKYIKTTTQVIKLEIANDLKKNIAVSGAKLVEGERYIKIK
jgi:hypothetical protein